MIAAQRKLRNTNENSTGGQAALLGREFATTKEMGNALTKLHAFRLG